MLLLYLEFDIWPIVEVILVAAFRIVMFLILEPIRRVTKSNG
jgi:nitrate reductase NapE component